jgi:hypothetical protein
MKALLAAVALAATLTTAAAGQTCEPKPPAPWAVQRSIELAERTRQALDASGAQVVLLARAGQDLSRYGLQWSHLGWAYRDANGWRVLHKLNACGSPHASIYRQGLGEFFLDDLWQYQAGYVVPQRAAQDQLLPLLRDNARATRLHQRAYSMVAYPWASTYQQSNQWAIETFALAVEPAVASRAQAQAWLQFKGYEPSVLRIGALTRLGARVGTAHIAFDDHPNEKRFADRIETVTVDSVFAWMARSGLGGAVHVVR